MALCGSMGAFPFGKRDAWASAAVSADDLPELEGSLTLYLGRGEGGLYEDVLDAIAARNPKFDLRIRRGSTAALANTIVAEAKAGVLRADLFWAVDSGAIGLVTAAGIAKALPSSLTGQLQQQFQFPDWLPVTGRIRSLAYNTERIAPDTIPHDIMAFADSKISIAWAPAYASFQSFITGMRILEGDKATTDWLRAISARAKPYAGELGVVMAVERGAADIGFANHYYTLRLKSGRPDANIDLAFTREDAGCLVNASGILALKDGETPINFMRYLLTQEVQTYLANEAFEIPLVSSVATPAGLPSLATISPPTIDLTKLSDIRPTLDLMRAAGVL